MNVEDVAARVGDARATVRDVLAPLAREVLAIGDEYGWWLLGGFLVVAAGLPSLLNDFTQTVLLELFMFGVLALSWDLVGGWTGYPSFGNMAFFGVGAYTTAILVKEFGLAFPPAFLAAGVLSVAFAAAVGLAVLRLRGGYFAIATLGVLLASIEISRNLEITGGSSGKILLDVPSNEFFYYVFLGLLVVEVGLAYYLADTRFGYVLNTIRDDEDKATAMGVNTTYYKTAAWTLSALFTGLAGGAWSLYNTFVDPQTAYNLAWNVEFIAMALIGGTGTVAGAVLGAFGLRGLILLVIDPLFPGWQLVVLGLVVVAVVVGFPNGIVGTLREWASAMQYYEVAGGAAGAEGGQPAEATAAADPGDPEGTADTAGEGGGDS